jgi:hypothetical protein
MPRAKPKSRKQPDVVAPLPPQGVHYNPQEYALIPSDEFSARYSVHPMNPRKGSTEEVGESIDEIGWYGCVLVQKSTGYILVGNHRTPALIARDGAVVPTLILDVDDERALRILLNDNKTAQNSTWDHEGLKSVLELLLPTGAPTGWKAYEIDLALRAAPTSDEWPSAIEGKVDNVAATSDGIPGRIVVSCDQADVSDVRAAIARALEDYPTAKVA